jgi:hypothetical protein
VASSKGFLSDFKKLYEEESSFWKDLVVLLVEALVAQTIGKSNVPYGPSFLTFLMPSMLQIHKLVRL